MDASPGWLDGRPVGHRQDVNVLDIRLPRGLAPFRLARRKRISTTRTGGGRPRRFIDAIERVGVQETLCIQVAAQDSLYVTDDFLVTHNTLNDAFIILDEAQNTSPEQMKMFLTRLGFGSKIVVTGDVTQVDLPGGTQVRAAGRRGASSTASRTSSSTGSPATTWSGTGWSATSSRRTTSSTPAATTRRRRPPTRDAEGRDEHRGAQRVRRRARRPASWPR